MNRFKKKHKAFEKFKNLSLVGASARVIKIGLPIILLYLLAFLIMISRLSEDIPTYIIARTYFDTLEHIAVSALLIISGALLLDMLEKKISKND